MFLTGSIVSNLEMWMWKESHYRNVKKYSSMIRQKFNDVGSFNNFRELVKNKKCLKLFSSNVKDKKNFVLKGWPHHYQFELAQKLGRCQEMFLLYSTWWKKHALSDFIKKMRQNLSKRGKEFALGAISFSSYNWDQNRIQETEIKKYAKEFEYIDILKEHTICLSCDPTKKFDNTSICKCSGTKGKTSNKSYDDWTPFIENHDLVVWRRLHPSGYYEYKMFGSYSDVSAVDFLNVQIDTDYRKKWDNTAVKLEVNERDPQEGENGDIVYWEMQWPVSIKNSTIKLSPKQKNADNFLI